MKINELTVISLSVALMLVLGYVIEIGSLITFSYVKPSPSEGMLVFILMNFGLATSLIATFSYMGILFMIKGLSIFMIEEVALLIACSLILFSYQFVKNKKISFFAKSVIVISITSILMTILNAFFIFPTYINIGSGGGYVTYKSGLIGKTFLEALWRVIVLPPTGGGILHGNIIKYSLVMLLAYYANKVYKNFRK